MKLVIELRNKATFWVSEAQAEAVDKVWRTKGVFKLDGASINTADIVGIWPENTWYEIHPEDRPRNLPTIKPELLEEPKSSPLRDKWIEVLALNKKLLADGKKPKYVVADGEITEQENFWFDAPDNNPPVPLRWATKEFFGRMAKKIEDLAGEGLGYRVVRRDGKTIEAAYRTLTLAEDADWADEQTIKMFGLN